MAQHFPALEGGPLDVEAAVSSAGVEVREAQQGPPLAEVTVAWPYIPAPQSSLAAENVLTLLDQVLHGGEVSKAQGR